MLRNVYFIFVSTLENGHQASVTIAKLFLNRRAVLLTQCYKDFAVTKPFAFLERVWNSVAIVLSLPGKCRLSGKCLSNDFRLSEYD